MFAVSIADVPSQEFDVVLGGQSCHVALYTRTTGLYMDVYRDDTLLFGGALCVNGVPVMRTPYLGLVGDLLFIDTQGVSDPTSPGLGTRFALMYLDPSDLAALT